MDLARRYALGQLAEVLGAKVLPIDEEQRYAAIGPTADRQWQHLGRYDRSLLEAYSDGVNAAITLQPLPPEFRLLAYRPRAWSPRDCLAVAAVATLELADSWHRIFSRDAVWRRNGPRGFDTISPLSDPRYDVALDGTHVPNDNRGILDSSALAGTARGGLCNIRDPAVTFGRWETSVRDGRALLANDPHLDLTIPGIWYLVDVRFPGVPLRADDSRRSRLVLGHNERIAWGASNAQTATASVYDAGALSHGG